MKGAKFGPLERIVKAQSNLLFSVAYLPFVSFHLPTKSNRFDVTTFVTVPILVFV